MLTLKYWNLAFITGYCRQFVLSKHFSCEFNLEFTNKVHNIRKHLWKYSVNQCYWAIETIFIIRLIAFAAYCVQTHKSNIECARSICFPLKVETSVFTYCPIWITLSMPIAKLYMGSLQIQSIPVKLRRWRCFVASYSIGNYSILVKNIRSLNVYQALTSYNRANTKTIYNIIPAVKHICSSRENVPDNNKICDIFFHHICIRFVAWRFPSLT